MIEQERGENEIEFTVEELRIIQRGLYTEMVEVYLPPVNKQDAELIASASQKVGELINLMTQEDDR